MSDLSPASLDRLRNLRLPRPDLVVHRERKTRAVLLSLCIYGALLAGFGLLLRHYQLLGMKSKAISNQMEGRKPAESIAQLLEYLQNYPRDAEANFRLGLFLLPEDAPLAAECFGRAIELNYRNVSAYRYYGDALWRLRRKRAAEAAYKEFLRRAASDPREATQVSYVRGRLREINTN